MDVMERSVAVTGTPGERGGGGVPTPREVAVVADTPRAMDNAMLGGVTGDTSDGGQDMEQLVGGLIRFSFCRRLQNQTLTTSFSMVSDSASWEISSEVGFGLCKKDFSRANRTVVSMLVRFFRLRPIDSGVVCALVRAAGLFMEASASSSHRCSNGFSLHMFLKLRFRASNLEIVV